MKRRIIFILIVLAVVGIALGVLLPAFTGLPFIRRTIVDELHNPVQIASVQSNGLVTAHGNIIHLHFVQAIPATNQIFIAATQHGVEVDADGRVIGLIDVHHWCGNDPIGKQLGRIDVAALALYLGSTPTEDAPDLVRDLGHRSLTRSRIDPGDYGNIETISKIMEMGSPTR